MNGNERPEEGVSLLRRMLEIPSPTGGTDTLRSFLESWMEERGFDVDRSWEWGVRARFGSARGGHILLLGHIDTVRGEIPVREDAGCVTGRGAVDAKGPFAAGLLAVLSLRGSGGPAVEVVGACDEEGVSRCARSLVQEALRAESVPWSRAVVLEPSGWDAVTIGYRGQARVDITSRRRASHAVRAEHGAIDECIRTYLRIRDDLHRGPGFNDVSVRAVGVEHLLDGVEEVCTLHLDIRLPPGSHGSGVLSSVAAICDVMGCEHVVRDHIPPVLAGKRDRLVSVFIASIRAAGGTPRFKKKTGTCDMNILAEALDIPMLAYGPGDSSLDHSPDERIDLAEFERGVRVLRGALLRLAPG